MELKASRGAALRLVGWLAGLLVVLSEQFSRTVSYQFSCPITSESVGLIGDRELGIGDWGLGCRVEGGACCALICAFFCAFGLAGPWSWL